MIRPGTRVRLRRHYSAKLSIDGKPAGTLTIARGLTGRVEPHDECDGYVAVSFRTGSETPPAIALIVTLAEQDLEPL
jgi:hypothetical protein